MPDTSTNSILTAQIALVSRGFDLFYDALNLLKAISDQINSFPSTSPEPADDQKVSPGEASTTDEAPAAEPAPADATAGSVTSPADATVGSFASPFNDLHAIPPAPLVVEDGSELTA